MKTHGADILRLWVVSGDYTEDLRIGKEILDGIADTYRRLRNTLRYLLGNLAGFTEAERLPRGADARARALGAASAGRARRAGAQLQPRVRLSRGSAAQLHNFCAVDLSAFYFDVRKDALYCDPVDSVRRRAARTVLDELFRCLTAWLAPVLVFTAEEAWLTRFPHEGSVHLRTVPRRAGRLARRRRSARAGSGSARSAAWSPAPWSSSAREKRIGASLQAGPDRLSRREADRRCWQGSTSPSSRSPAASCSPTARRPPAPSRSTMCRAWPWCPAWPRARNACAAGGSCPRSRPRAEHLCRRCTDAVATARAA